MSNNNTKYKDFARGEIYAFHRMTITLSTFFLTASFAISALEMKPENPCIHLVNLFALIGIAFACLVNIIIAWIWLKKSMYDYYNKKDDYAKLPEKEKALVDRIENNAEKWDNAIRITFYICFSLFIFFLLTYGVFAQFKKVI